MTPVDPAPGGAWAGGSEDALDTVFAALADPTRRTILAMLLEDDMAVTDVAGLRAELDALAGLVAAQLDQQHPFVHAGQDTV